MSQKPTGFWDMAASLSVGSHSIYIVSEFQPIVKVHSTAENFSFSRSFLQNPTQNNTRWAVIA